MFESVFAITLPVFLIVLIGFSSVKLSLFPKEGVKALGAFVVTFGVPATLFRALSNSDIEALLHLPFMLVFGLGSVLTFATVFTIAKKLRGKGITASALMAMGGSFPNTLLIGFPIILELLGPVALIPLAIALLIENLVMMPLTFALVEVDKSSSGGFLKAFLQAISGLYKNPFIIAISLGVFCSVLSIQLPSAATKVIDMLAATVGGVALFAIGGMLAGIKLRGMLGGVTIVAGGKLLLHPLFIVSLILFLPPMDPVYLTVLLILSSLPMFAVYAVIGQKYGEGELCSAAVLLTTSLSFITINTTIYILQVFGYVVI